MVPLLVIVSLRADGVSPAFSIGIGSTKDSVAVAVFTAAAAFFPKKLDRSFCFPEYSSQYLLASLGASLVESSPPTQNFIASRKVNLVPSWVVISSCRSM